MTMADAINRARTGESEGFADLFRNTAPSVWIAAAVLGCPNIGTTVTQIYRDAQQAVSSLRSPSDLRVWIGRITYRVLLQLPEVEGCAMPWLTGDAAEAYGVIAKLPQKERTALLLMCGDGCSASQAAEILSDPDIEIKRALRRARQTIAAHMKQQGCTQNCNTTWLISLLSDMREAQRENAAKELEQVLGCVQSGEAFVEPTSEPVQQSAAQERPEKNTFFSKLFRSRRFG